MTDRPEIPSPDTIRAAAELLEEINNRYVPSMHEDEDRADCVVALLLRTADALEAATPAGEPIPGQAPAVDVDVIRDAVEELSRWIAGAKTAEILNRIRAALPPKSLKWGPVMVTEDGKPVLASVAPDAQGLHSITMHWSGDPVDVTTWYCHPDGDPLPSADHQREYPRIIGPWTGE